MKRTIAFRVRQPFLLFFLKNLLHRRHERFNPHLCRACRRLHNRGWAFFCEGHSEVLDREARQAVDSLRRCFSRNVALRFFLHERLFLERTTVFVQRLPQRCVAFSRSARLSLWPCRALAFAVLWVARLPWRRHGKPVQSASRRLYVSRFGGRLQLERQTRISKQ